MWSHFNDSFPFALSDKLWKKQKQKLHLTTYLLSLYLVKFECSIVQLFIYDSHSTQRQTVILFRCCKFGGIFDQWIYF